MNNRTYDKHSLIMSDQQNNNLENEGEYTPKLFSDESQSLTENNFDEINEIQSEKLNFDQDIEEEDFEIPAFLRKQKF